jgi:hypothetical protein
MTENTTRTTTAPAMKSVDHTHPDTDRPFGERVVFERGPMVAADGGERGVASEKKTDESESETEAEKQMKDVDHEPPNEAEANRVFERGREGRDDTR